MTTTNKNTTIACGDGCGEQANPGRRFRPGHDARLASLLLKTANGQLTTSQLPKLVSAQLAAGTLRLPGATLKTVTVSVTIGIAVAPDQSDEDTKAEVRRVLGRKSITVRKLVVGKPAPKPVRKPAAAAK